MGNVLDMFSVAGKKAIVTGGSRGLCFGMADILHQAGAEVVIVGRNEETLRSAAEKIGNAAEKMGGGAKVHTVAGDLSQLDQIETIYNQCLEKLSGRLDILVNGAGLQHRAKAEDFPLDKWQLIINTNASALFLLSQQAGRTMLAQKSGKIINVASVTSFSGSEMIPAYVASKGAVMQITKALSNEWAQHGINVNAIAPGYMVTELTADMKEKNPTHYKEITDRIPAHRWGQPEDLYGITLFLASEASQYVSGSIITVDGGYLGK